MKAKLLAASLAALSVFVGGCVVAPSAPRYVETVRVAPPPPYVEYIGQPPYVGYVWITGYWNWGGTRYVWVPGRWEKPRDGHRWVPHRWERNGDHWRQHGGHWERDHRHAPRSESRESHDSPRIGSADQRRDDSRGRRDFRGGEDRQDRISREQEAASRHGMSNTSRREANRGDERIGATRVERETRIGAVRQQGSDDDERDRRHGREGRPERDRERGEGRRGRDDDR